MSPVCSECCPRKLHRQRLGPLQFPCHRTWRCQRLKGLCPPLRSNLLSGSVHLLLGPSRHPPAQLHHSCCVCGRWVGRSPVFLSRCPRKRGSSPVSPGFCPRWWGTCWVYRSRYSRKRGTIRACPGFLPTLPGRCWASPIPYPTLWKTLWECWKFAPRKLGRIQAFPECLPRSPHPLCLFLGTSAPNRLGLWEARSGARPFSIYTRSPGR